MNQWPLQKSMNAFYGNPDANGDGRADASWEAVNIVRIKPPFPMWYPNEVDGKIIKRAKQWTGIPVHKKCSESLSKILAQIGNAFTPEELNRYELDICGGAFNFRLMRSGRALSIHSWGAAIDLSHLINYYKRKYEPSKGMMPERAIKIFESEGWVWGGLWSTGDAMHFQAARL